MTHFLKQEPFRSKKYLAWVKSLPCSACAMPESSDPHHLISVGLGGTTGGKEDDSLIIPLCRFCHNLVHANKMAIDQPYYFMKVIKQAFREGVITVI